MPNELVIILALIAVVPTTISGVIGVLTFVQLRRLQPTTIKAAEAGVAQDQAETDTIKITNDRTLYSAYKELVADMAEVLRKQVGQESEIAGLKLQNTRLESIAADAVEAARIAEARYVALDERTKDYPHRLELAEREIDSLKATIQLKDDQAAQVSQTRLNDSQARRSVADTALIAAGGTPLPDSAEAEAQSGAPDKAATAIQAISEAQAEQGAAKPPYES